MLNSNIKELFNKIDKKRNDLVQAQLENDPEWADCIKKEINLLLDLLRLED